MTKQTAISNEEIISALMGCNSIAKASEKLGLSTRAIYSRMAEPEFKTAYGAARADVLRLAVHSLQSCFLEAVGTAREIMADSSVTPAARLQAAKLILDSIAKFSDRLTASDKSASAYAAQARWIDTGE